MAGFRCGGRAVASFRALAGRSEEHTSELQSRLHLGCRLLLEKKNTITSDAESMSDRNLSMIHMRTAISRAAAETMRPSTISNLQRLISPGNTITDLR